MPSGLKTAIDKTCLGCHSGAAAKGGLDFTSLSFDLRNRVTRERWVRVHDRIEKGEMPPKGVEFSAAERTAILGQLAPLLYRADLADVAKNGRGPMRRLNRDEYEQDLRDILRLPHLDIRDMLPEDREAHHFNKVSETLDMSRVQLAAYLDASEAALRAGDGYRSRAAWRDQVPRDGHESVSRVPQYWHDSFHVLHQEQ